MANFVMSAIYVYVSVSHTKKVLDECRHLINLKPIPIQVLENDSQTYVQQAINPSL